MASLPVCQRYLRYPFHCFAWVQNFTFNLYLVRETAEHEVDFWVRSALKYIIQSAFSLS